MYSSTADIFHLPHQKEVHSSSVVGVLLPYLLNSCHAPQKLVYSSSSIAYMQNLSFKNLQLIKSTCTRTHTSTHTHIKSVLHFLLVTQSVFFQPNKPESHKHKYVYSLVKNIFSRYCSIQQAWLVNLWRLNLWGKRDQPAKAETSGPQTWSTVTWGRGVIYMEHRSETLSETAVRKAGGLWSDWLPWCVMCTGWEVLSSWFSGPHGSVGFKVQWSLKVTSL